MNPPWEIVDRLVAGAVSTLGDGLVSVIVHGSMAWGCWGPSSDLDVLAVTEDDADLTAFGPMVVALDAEAPGGGFELSVLSRTAARHGPHPIEYRYHYSRGATPGSERGGRDPDLAGHLRVARTTGVCAYGRPAREVFREVTDEEFLDSVGTDVRESLEFLDDLTADEVPVPVYAVLNTARTLAWRRDGLMLSKRGGGEWLRAREPGYAALLTAALDEYENPQGRLVRTADLRSLARDQGS